MIGAEGSIQEKAHSSEVSRPSPELKIPYEDFALQELPQRVRTMALSLFDDYTCWRELTALGSQYHQILFQRIEQISDERNSDLNANLLAVGLAIIVLAVVVISPYSNVGARLRDTGRPVVRYGFIIVVIGIAIIAIGLGLPG